MADEGVMASIATNPDLDPAKVREEAFMTSQSAQSQTRYTPQPTPRSRHAHHTTPHTAKVVKHAVEDSGTDEAAARVKLEELIANPHHCCLKASTA